MLKARQILPALAAAALPLGPVAAQEADCPTMRLLTNSEADLSALSLQYGADGLLDLQVSGKADVLTDALRCEIAGADDFSAKCEWEAPAQADAQAHFNRLRAKIDQCLPWAEMKLEPGTYNSDTMTVMQVYSGKAGGDEYGLGGTDITLQIGEFRRFDNTSYFWVDLEFSR